MLIQNTMVNYQHGPFKNYFPVNICTDLMHVTGT
jgi:hypothetical protein